METRIRFAVQAQKDASEAAAMAARGYHIDWLLGDNSWQLAAEDASAEAKRCWQSVFGTDERRIRLAQAAVCRRSEEVAMKVIARLLREVESA